MHNGIVIQNMHSKGEGVFSKIEPTAEARSLRCRECRDVLLLQLSHVGRPERSRKVPGVWSFDVQAV